MPPPPKQKMVVPVAARQLPEAPKPAAALIDRGFQHLGKGRETRKISIVYPSAEFKAEKDSAVSTQASLHKEAEEHYQLIRAITKENVLGYQQWLKLMQSRKSRVKNSLYKSPEWALISATLGRK